jgi:hypothetical protein
MEQLLYGVEQVLAPRAAEDGPSPAGRVGPYTASDAAPVGRVLAFAEATLDLAGIATGAAGEVGRGPESEPRRCLDYVLDKLYRFPGRGERLIEVGLLSPVGTNRFVAAALAAWPRA